MEVRRRVFANALPELLGEIYRAGHLLIAVTPVQGRIISAGSVGTVNAEVTFEYFDVYFVNARCR